MDPKLVEIARLAEAGEACPPLSIVTSSHFIRGVPVSTDVFNETADSKFEEIVAAEVRSRFGRRDREQETARVVAEFEPLMSKVYAAREEDTAGVLTLQWPIYWAWGEASGLQLPVSRLSIQAIASWWIGDGKQIKGDTSGGGWFFGVSMPIPG